MSAAPRWLDDIIADFGRGAGLQNFTLGERGAAALAGERGTAFYFEYVQPDLLVRMTAEVQKTPETARKVLLFAEPTRQGAYPIRAGFMPHSDKAFFAVKLPQDAVTLPTLTDIFRELRRLAERFTQGGVA